MCTNQAGYRLLLAEAELRGARELGKAAIDALMAGRPLGMMPSVLKLSTADTIQRIADTEVMLEKD